MSNENKRDETHITSEKDVNFAKDQGRITTIKESPVGVAGDHAHIEGGIHHETVKIKANRIDQFVQFNISPDSYRWFVPLISVLSIAGISISMTLILLRFSSAEVEKISFYEKLIVVLAAAIICIAFMLTLSKIYKNFIKLMIIFIPLWLASSIISSAYILDKPIFEVIKVIIFQDNEIKNPSPPNQEHHGKQGDTKKIPDSKKNEKSDDSTKPKIEQPVTTLGNQTEKQPILPPVTHLEIKSSESVGSQRNTSLNTNKAWVNIKPDYTNNIGMKFVYIPPGEFMMGSPETEEERYPWESPLHSVKITEGFYIQATEVTQGQWKAVMGNNPSYFKDCGDNCPVENVSWNNVQEFIKKLNEKEGAEKYRLPTEAEWEYACRSGTTTRFYTGDTEADLSRAGWYSGNSDRKTHRVCEKEPNAFGLYDMHGNVWEWVEDDWHRSYMNAPIDGSAWIDNPRGSPRVVRGGSWGGPAQDCRSAFRDGFSPGGRGSNVGFRLFLRS